MKKGNLFLCFMLSMLMIGCGDDAGTTVQEANSVNENGNNDEDAVDDIEEAEENEGTNDNDMDVDRKPLNDSESGVEEITFSDKEEEMEGMVQSVGEDIVVISKIFSGESEVDGLYYAFSPGEGSDEEELIKVHITSETKFQLQTIKSGGEDVTEKEGKFTDIKEDVMIRVTGYMDETKAELKAKEVVIIEVIS